MEIHSPADVVPALGPAPLRAYEQALTEAARARSRTAAARWYVEASYAAGSGGELQLAYDAARRAATFARAADRNLRAEADFALGWAQLRVRPRAGRRTVREALARLGRATPPAIIGSRAGFLLVWLEEYDAALDLLEASVETARKTNDVWLANVLDTCGIVDYKLGRWDRADARSAESRRVAAEAGQDAQVASSHTTLARIAAARGRETEARGHLGAAAEIASEQSIAWAYGATALGLLELGLDRPAAAAAAFERLDASGMGNEPSLFEWDSDWIEALVREGRTRDAATVLGRLETRVASSPRRSAKASVARCRGLLAPASEIDDAFGDALRLHTAPTPFERARTELCYGERLRRARRRADARIQLRSALAAFEQLGAATWAERTRRELGATRTPRSDKADQLTELLTTHELQVASRVQQGLSNREIAAALFVTERTIEYHLTNIYRKLAISSRTQLVSRFSRG